MDKTLLTAAIFSSTLAMNGGHALGTKVGPIHSLEIEISDETNATKDECSLSVEEALSMNEHFPEPLDINDVNFYNNLDCDKYRLIRKRGEEKDILYYKIKN